MMLQVIVSQNFPKYDSELVTEKNTGAVKLRKGNNTAAEKCKEKSCQNILTRSASKSANSVNITDTCEAFSVEVNGSQTAREAKVIEKLDPPAKVTASERNLVEDRSIQKDSAKQKSSDKDLIAQQDVDEYKERDIQDKENNSGSKDTMASHKEGDKPEAGRTSMSDISKTSSEEISKGGSGSIAASSEKPQDIHDSDECGEANETAKRVKEMEDILADMLRRHKEEAEEKTNRVEEKRTKEDEEEKGRDVEPEKYKEKDEECEEKTEDQKSLKPEEDKITKTSQEMTDDGKSKRKPPTKCRTKAMLLQRLRQSTSLENLSDYAKKPEANESSSKTDDNLGIANQKLSDSNWRPAVNVRAFTQPIKDSSLRGNKSSTPLSKPAPVIKARARKLDTPSHLESNNDAPPTKVLKKTRVQPQEGGDSNMQRTYRRTKVTGNGNRGSVTDSKAYQDFVHGLYETKTEGRKTARHENPASKRTATVGRLKDSDSAHSCTSKKQ